MNRAKLRSYAPQARRDFIRAVTDRARKVGLTALHSESVQVQGDVAIIGGQAFPKAVATQRKRLDEQIESKGFDAVMEEAAYTWFNRFMAIRYMEVHEYLEHGYRVLSHPNSGVRPEILEQAEHVDLPGLDRVKVIDLKLDGTKDEELYKSLLLAQCRALHQAMPFLFEQIDDATELLLPDGLLASDSLIRKMVIEISEHDWQQIEVIGWLYQFYISEKKDEVMGKVVKSEDIPAATQLFTPNWIVKYMVQNSLGAKWLATYPNSPLRGKMEYYIEPAEQTEEVNAQLAAITPTSLNPETITLMDPACGSGHILVEAYDLFREIYMERGYRPRDIPRLILEKNLFGLDIDDRAAQMARFALLMKARAEDRRLLQDVPRLNVRAIQSSAGIKMAEIADALLTPRYVELVASNELFPETRRQPALTVEEKPNISRSDIADLLMLFTDAKTVGSLLTVPATLTAKIPHFRALLDVKDANAGFLQKQAVEDLESLVVQSELLGGQYDAVVANPPYMGNKFLNNALKSYVQRHYSGCEKDLFSAFIRRNLSFTKDSGRLGFMSPMVWMFISSQEYIRRYILDNSNITSLIQFEYNASGDVRVPLCVYCLSKPVINQINASFIRLSDFPGQDIQRIKTLEAILNPKCGWFYVANLTRLRNISSSPISYWLGEGTFKVMNDSSEIRDVCEARQGLSTGETNKFIRHWYEVAFDNIAFGCKNSEEFQSTKRSWAPYNKGGEYRKYYGNADYVVLWKNSGEALKRFEPKSIIRNEEFYFKESLSWSDVTSSHTSFRYYPSGFIFDTVGHSAFYSDESKFFTCLGYLNGKLVQKIIPAINPTLHFSGGYFLRLPYLQKMEYESFQYAVRTCIKIAVEDWDSQERSWDFQRFPLLNGSLSLIDSFDMWKIHSLAQWNQMKRLEEENNRQLIDAYELSDELTPEVPDAQITLTRADREHDMRRLVSYALGCMMGRYSLNEPGLIYAQSGNGNFNPSRYTIFPADDDGILPLTDTEWFDNNDTANRFAAFLRVAWPAETLNENLTFVADSLGTKAGENALDTIRRYLHTGFYKDHLQTYKKRPIYWLFASGKERAFQALVYLHRYNSGTLSRMRIEYVIPLQSRISARIAQLEQDIAAATSTADRNKRQKERDKLVRQQTELLHFDEKLRYYADQRITLDLDDGVKVNYGRFGDLLADVKAITGDKDD